MHFIPTVRVALRGFGRVTSICFYYPSLPKRNFDNCAVKWGSYERERFLCKIKKYFLCVTQNIWLEYRYSLGMGEVDFPYVPMTTIQWKFSSTDAGKTTFYRHMQRQWSWTNIQFAQIYWGVYWPSLHSLEVHKAQGPCSEELLADAFNFLSPVLSRSFRSRTSSSGTLFP